MVWPFCFKTSIKKVVDSLFGVNSQSFPGCSCKHRGCLIYQEQTSQEAVAQEYIIKVRESIPLHYGTVLLPFAWVVGDLVMIFSKLM